MTPQPMHGAPDSTHQETDWFQRVTGQTVKVCGPRQPSRIQAVALSLLRAAKLIDKLAVLKVSAARAVVMNGLVEQRGGLVLAIELGQAAHQRVLHNDGDQPLGVSRAARNVDHRGGDSLLGKEFLNSHGVRVVGASGHPTAVASARAKRDHGIGMLGGLHKGVDTLFATDHQNVAIKGSGDSALIDENISTRLDGIATSLLH